MSAFALSGSWSGHHCEAAESRYGYFELVEVEVADSNSVLGEFSRFAGDSVRAPIHAAAGEVVARLRAPAHRKLGTSSVARDGQTGAAAFPCTKRVVLVAGQRSTDWEALPRVTGQTPLNHLSLGTARVEPHHLVVGRAAPSELWSTTGSVVLTAGNTGAGVSVVL
jgi:hypothetical protein